MAIRTVLRGGFSRRQILNRRSRALSARVASRPAQFVSSLYNASEFDPVTLLRMAMETLALLAIRSRMGIQNYGLSMHFAWAGFDEPRSNRSYCFAWIPRSVFTAAQESGALSCGG